MKRAYKQAMDQVTVSEQLKAKLLDAAASPQPHHRWLKPVCSAAACFALLCTAGVWGMQQVGITKDAAVEDSCTGTTATASVNGYSAEAAFDGMEEAKTETEQSTKATDTKGSDVKESASVGSDTASPEEGTSIANPLVTYNSLKEAAAALDFTPIVPDEAGEADVTIIAGDTLQLSWQEEETFFIYRTAEGDADISGDYNSWTATETVELCGLDTTLKGDGETVSVVLWQQEGMTFSLTADPGVSVEKVEAIIE